MNSLVIVPFGPPKPGEFSIGHIVPRKGDVDALLGQAVAAGATVTTKVVMGFVTDEIQRVISIDET
jgi:hypothetical protein